MQKLFSIGFILFFVIAFSINAEEVTQVKIEEVKISSPAINPSKGEECTISYKLSQPSPVTIKIYDENNQLVRTLLKGGKRKAGINEEIWDGRDNRRTILSTEVYTFTIEAKNCIYDPASSSGGEFLSKIDASAKKTPPYSISYTLPTSARVRIRIGVKAGPLYRTLIDWQPKPSGSYTEQWDGKDKTGKVELGSDPSCFISVESFSLPENSIILTGATQQQKKLKTQPTKQEIKISSRQLYEHALHPRYRCKDPEMKIILPKGVSYTEDGLPIISGEVPLIIELDDKVLKWLKEENAEYLFYIDDKFLSEEEQISSPYTWGWDSRQYENGEHILAVNIRSFNDHCATDCIRVYVKNE